MERSNSHPRPDARRTSFRGATTSGVPALLAVFLGLTVGTTLWMPAAALSRILPEALHCERWSGRVWRGRCEKLLWRGTALGQLSWTWSLRPLGERRLAGAILWERADSWIRTEASVDAAGVVRAVSLEGTLALSTLRSLIGPQASNVTRDLRLDGRLEAKLEALDLQLPNGAPPWSRLPTLLRLEGQLSTRDLRWLGSSKTPGMSLPLGDIHARWEGDTATRQPFATRLKSLESARDFQGEIQFPEGRGYRLNVVATDAERKPVSLEITGRW